MKGDDDLNKHKVDVPKSNIAIKKPPLNRD